MIQIDFVEPATQEWKEWRALCDKEQVAHNTAIESGENSVVKSSIYKGQKHIYIDPNGSFHGKCAYCEQKIYGDQHGDIEHFRPKSGLKDYRTGESVTIKLGGKDQEHPGYYWLAYDWQNLLPSCILCNQPSSTHSSHPIGKRDYFPVKGAHATIPGGEVDEEPLLIHPVLENPEDDLQIDKTGIFHAKNGSLRGKTCIEIFGLNERDLPNRRKSVYKHTRERISISLQMLALDGPTGDVKERLAEIKKIKQGFDEFTIAARKAISDCAEDCSINW